MQSTNPTSMLSKNTSLFSSNSEGLQTKLDQLVQVFALKILQLNYQDFENTKIFGPVKADMQKSCLEKQISYVDFLKYSKIQLEKHLGSEVSIEQKKAISRKIDQEISTEEKSPRIVFTPHKEVVNQDKLVVMAGDQDHIERSVLLGTKVKETTALLGHFDLSKTQDTTLTLWGHSDHGNIFSGYSPEQLVNCLIKMNIENSNIKTIEILSCDVSNPLFQTNRSFSERFLDHLKQKNINIKVKSFPKGTEASKSILWFYKKPGMHSFEEFFMYIMFENEFALSQFNEFFTSGIPKWEVEKVVTSGKHNYNYRTGKLEEIRNSLVEVESILNPSLFSLSNAKSLFNKSKYD